MGSLKLQSFEDFATASKAAAEAKVQEEQKAARTESAYKFETLLSEFGVTSVKDLNEEDRNKFFAKLGASEVSESLAIIEEGTRSQIGIISKRGKIESVYMHYDGYPDHMLPTIKKGYMNSGTVKFLLKKGGGSGLEADPSKINFYGDKATLKGDAKKVDDYISDASDKGGAEFVYLFDERDGKWYMADVYGDKELVPAFESLTINEAFKPSKGNARDAKKVSKFLNTFFTKHSAIANSDSFLGACRYLLAEALTDANFHSYRDPVSKALGGKISTIMVDIDNLGGMSIPVGKKTIMNLLDEHYSGIANAAGWSGIGIVEGMALFLDGFGYSQQAQKIVDAFELIWANESVMNEGNAFLAARAKAIEEDASEFEFNGKTYPVIKEEVEVEEGNEFGAARAKAIANDEDEFEVDGETYPVTKVDKEDKENAEEFVEEAEEDLNEGVHPKIKKAMKAVDKGETVYGENIRFPGRFKIIEIDDMFATVDYEDGTEPMKMAAMNIAIDKLKFEAVEVEEGNAFGAARAEAIAKGEKTFKVGDEEYDVEDVDADDKENAEEFVEESVNEASRRATDFYGDSKHGKSIDSLLKGKWDSKKVESFLEELGGGNDVKYVRIIDFISRDAGLNTRKYKNIDEQLPDLMKQLEVLYKDFLTESEVSEAEVKSDEDFKEYAFAVLQQAFGDKFDEEKAQEVVDGLLTKHDGDYGAAVGALQSSLG